jgi:hypothetical protein
MKKIKIQALQLASAVKRYSQVTVVLLIIAMFVLAAGAPNATIGIGK